MAERVQRINYHTGLFLEQEEFRLEQNYHLLMRYRLNFALFRPGVLYGMDLDYNGTILVVRPGMAIDDFTDSSGERLGREIILLANSPPVALPGFNNGDTVWITIRHDAQTTDPKAPTDIASRITEIPRITTHNANPGPGTLEILVGNIVVGTPSLTAAVQTAVLKLAGGVVPVPPSINNFSPLSGSVGTSVTITGSHFTGATAVGFGGVAATQFTVDSDTQITATVPAGATTGPITVSTPAGSGASATTFQVSGVPSITGFTPASGVAGTVVTITGSSFTGATAVSFGGVNATSFTVVSAVQITATVPASAATGRIRVTTPAGFAESATDFQIVGAPTVTSFNPASGGVGTLVTVTGNNFTGATAVSVGGVAAGSFNVVSNTQITVTVPSGAATGRIRVTTPAGLAESTTDFQVTAAPAFNPANPFTPRQGFQGNPVAINGQNFNVDSPTPPQVFFGTIQATATSFTAILIQVTVPAGGTPQQTVPIRVVTSGGEARSDSLIPPVLFRFL
jgi:IPT/TIG domain